MKLVPTGPARFRVQVLDPQAVRTYRQRQTVLAPWSWEVAPPGIRDEDLVRIALMQQQPISRLSPTSWLFNEGFEFDPQHPLWYFTSAARMDDVDRPPHGLYPVWVSLEEYLNRYPGSLLRLDLTPKGLHAWELGPRVQRTPDFTPLGTSGDPGYRGMTKVQRSWSARLHRKPERGLSDFVYVTLGLAGSGRPVAEAQRALDLLDIARETIHGPLNPQQRMALEQLGDKVRIYAPDPWKAFVEAALQEALR